MIVRHARTADAADGEDGPEATAVLLAAAPGPAAAQRLRGITEAGRDLGVAVILLGDWPHGTTCYITADGLITSVMPPEAGLAGTEAYHLAAADLAAIIAQLAEARDTPRRRPGRTRPAGNRTAAPPERPSSPRARPGDGTTPPRAAAATAGRRS